MTLPSVSPSAAKACGRGNVTVADDARVSRSNALDPLTNLTLVSALRRAFRAVFYDDPFDLINNLLTMDDSDERSELSKVDHYRSRTGDRRWYCLKPYTMPPPPPPSFFGRVIGAWNSSMLRLVLWRLVALNGVATGWWLMLLYWPEARVVVDDFSVMYSFFSLIFFLVLPQYLSITMDKYYLANEQFSLALSYTSDIASYLRGVIFVMDERSAIFVQERPSIIMPSNASSAYPSTMQLTAENMPSTVSFSVPVHDGAIVDLVMTPVDTIVHFQYLLHALPYAIVDEFRGVFAYDRLPLLPMQKYMLRVSNPHEYEELDTLLTELRSAAFLMENTHLLRSSGANTASLNGYINSISEKISVATSATNKSIPPAFSQLLDASTLIFCVFLPPVFFLEDTWWLQYLLYSIIVLFVYGIVRLAQEFRHQLQTKRSNPYAAVPVTAQANRKAAFIDSTIESAISIYLHNQHMREIEQNPYYLVSPKGELLLDSPGLSKFLVKKSPVPSASTATPRPLHVITHRRVVAPDSSHIDVI